jgi:hypothetical protein
MNFWEPGWTETLYTIAVMLFAAVLVTPLFYWLAGDDMNHVDDESTDMEIEL